MQYIQTLPNGVQIDMTYLILKQLQGEVTRDELQQVINDNIVTEACEDFIVDQGFSLNNIEWMYHKDGTIN